MNDLKYIQSYTHQGYIGVLVEFGLETSLPPRSEVFMELANNVALHIAASNPSNLEELLSQNYVKDPSISMKELIDKNSEKLLEKISINRFVRWDTEDRPQKPEDHPPKSPAVAMRVSK